MVLGLPYLLFSGAFCEVGVACPAEAPFAFELSESEPAEDMSIVISDGVGVAAGSAPELGAGFSLNFLMPFFLSLVSLVTLAFNFL